MLLLGRQNLLREPDGVDGAQLGSSGRQVLWPQSEVLIEAVQAVRRTVHAAPLVSSHCLPIVEEAHHRALVVAVHVPVFQEAQEVMHAAVSTEVRRATDLLERNPLSADDSRAVSRWDGIADKRPSGIAYMLGEGECIGIVPVVRKKRDRITDDRGGHACSGPGSIINWRVVVALNVNGILGGDGQTANNRSARGAEVQ